MFPSPTADSPKPWLKLWIMVWYNGYRHSVTTMRKELVLLRNHRVIYSFRCSLLTFLISYVFVVVTILNIIWWNSWSISFILLLHHSTNKQLLLHYNIVGDFTAAIIPLNISLGIVILLHHTVIQPYHCWIALSSSVKLLPPITWVSPLVLHCEN